MSRPTTEQTNQALELLRVKLVQGHDEVIFGEVVARSSCTLTINWVKLTIKDYFMTLLHGVTNIAR